MKLIDVRDLGNTPEFLRPMLKEGVVALTSGGEPFALLMELRENEDPAELERLIRQARAQRAVSRIRERARGNGIDNLGPDEIDVEIRAARGERSR